MSKIIKLLAKVLALPSTSRNFALKDIYENIKEVYQHYKEPSR